MTSSISDTTHSPAPFSPFTTHSGGSDLATSDGEHAYEVPHHSQRTQQEHVESPDLGAFTIVFRALNELQPRNFIPHAHAHAATTTVTPTTSTLSPMESESDANHRGSTVWNQNPIASYLSISSRTATTRLSVASSPPPSEPPSSDTEGEIMIDQETDGGDYEDGDNADEEQPSLGYLDEALQFIAAERAKLTVSTSWHHANSSTSDDPSLPRQRQQSHNHHHHQQQQQLTPRRRRRRRKARSIIPTVLARESSGAAADGNQSHTERLERGDPSDLSSPDNSSSEAAIRFSSTPASPTHKPGRRNTARSVSVDGRPRLGHSQSTPALRPGPLDPRVVRLRSLAIKLKFLFSPEAELLTTVLANESLLSSSPDFIDPRGPAPTPGEPLVHVFID